MMSLLKIPLLSSLLLLLSFISQAQTVTYNNPPAPKEQYFVNLLKLALADSGYRLEAAPEVMTEAKVKAELESGGIDVYWGPANKENAALYRPVYIPLLKGLLGYRLFIIKQGEQAKFDAIQNTNALKQLTGGQGRFWGDTQILVNAGLPIETSVKYDNLFYMLEGERFDYFPRAAHEPWVEVESHRELNLTVEKNLLLSYPLAMIFYVNKSDAALASAITSGLEKAIADGRFDEYFFGNPLVQSGLTQSNLAARRVIEIQNPFLPTQMPLDRKELWLDLDALRTMDVQ